MTNSTLETVVSYHELSKHRMDRYAPGPHGLDWATQPDPFRTYAGAPRTKLPLLADTLATPFSLTRSGSATPARPVTLENISILLQISLGLSAWKQAGNARWALRCNPSSGNLHPTEAYLICAGIESLGDGVHHYLSRDHVLEQRASPAPSSHPAFPANGFLLGLTSIHWREAWKYGVRAYRYCQHDCGHAIAAIRYAAAALGWQARLVDSWGDDHIAALLGLDRDEDFPDAEREAPDAMLWIGPATASPAPQDLIPWLGNGSWHGQANVLSSGHVPWDAIEEVGAAARAPGSAAPGGPDLPPIPSLKPPRRDMPASTLFRQRRSAVDFDGITSMDRDTFFGMLDALMPRPGTAPWDALTWSPLVHPAIFVHRVDGLVPGLYLLARDGSALDDLRTAMRPEWLWERADGCPAHLPLYLLLPHDLREAARAISCHQDIAADSAFSLGMLARFRPTLAHSPWWYRRLFWEAGMLGHVLYLEAEAAAVRGTGIGCFFDDEMHNLIGLTGDMWQDLYHFTVGGGVDDLRLQSMPPYP